ncbi:hypothetical protein [Cutibacterium sp. V947]|uniref:hypothetical protein n=1 Tax=Cutibacterium sp. V947 TaxID=3446480 RepID=UPI003EE0357B
MLSFLAAAFALGIAGFDPLGSFVLLAALGLGVRRRGVVILVLTSVGTSAIFGVAGVLGLGALLARLGIHGLHVPHLVWVWLVAILGVAFVSWGVWRLRPGAATKELDENTSAAPRSTEPGALAVSGLLVGLSSLVDPAFWAMLVHAAHLPHASWAVVESLIWVACSHSLLIVLVAAYLVGGPDRVTRVVTSIREDHAVAAHRGISALLAAFGVLLLADVIGVLATGQWFFEL